MRGDKQIKAPTVGEREGEGKIVEQNLGWILLPILLAVGVLQCVITFYIIRWMILGLWQHPHALFVLGAIGIVVLLLLVFPRSEPNSDHSIEDDKPYERRANEMELTTADLGEG